MTAKNKKLTETVEKINEVHGEESIKTAGELLSEKDKTPTETSGQDNNCYTDFCSVGEIIVPQLKKISNGENVFTELFKLDVSKYIEKKRTGSTELSYLSWAYAWAETKKRFPDANYRVNAFGQNQPPYVYDPNTGYMVFTEVTIEDLTHEMWLPVMDGANKAMKDKPYTYDTKYRKDIKVEAATMFDINKTIMRCLVKNLAMFGLGLYIFAGEDLPESPEQKEEKPLLVLEGTLKELSDVLASFGVEKEMKYRDGILQKHGKVTLSQLTQSEAVQMITKLKKSKEKEVKNA